jgi:phosphoribosyl-AMP cyclohydrolase
MLDKFEVKSLATSELNAGAASDFPVASAHREASTAVNLCLALTPNFDERGLLACVTQDAKTKQVLQFEWMDRGALARTMNTGLAHYFIHHRRGIWRRYPRAGTRYAVHQMLLNQEQNCLLLLVDVTTNQDPTTKHTSSFQHDFEESD